MRVKKCEWIFSCVLLFENISLSLPANVASQHFQEHVMKLYQRDETKLKDMLLFLENVYYLYIITKIII